MEKGIYLYCLREKSGASVKAVKTVGGGEAYAVPVKELEAVVSEVNLKEFSSEEVQRRAQEDLSWIKEKAQIHEHVIEQAMGGGGKITPVIPMRFGTIFKTEKGLEKTLKRGYSQFRRALGELKGKQEWGVKVYLNEALFARDISAGSGGAPQKDGPKKTDLASSQAQKWEEEKKKIASLPKGVDFFAKKKFDGAIKEERDKKLKMIIEEVFEGLRKSALKVSQGKLLDKALTGRKEPMVLNVSFLIKEERVEKFREEVGSLKAKYENLGLEICESGPWPPYNFVEVAGGGAKSGS